jgi:hypothetical protein
MNNYNYMAIGRKLCKADDQNNTVAGLIITTLVLGGCAYLQYRIIQDQKSDIYSIRQRMDNLSIRNSRQRQIIEEQQSTMQEFMEQLSKKDNETL